MKLILVLALSIAALVTVAVFATSENGADGKPYELESDEEAQLCSLR